MEFRVDGIKQLAFQVTLALGHFLKQKRNLTHAGVR